MSCPAIALNLDYGRFDGLQGMPARHSRHYGEKPERRGAEQRSQTDQRIGGTGH